jgi:hypothetical protein
VAAVATVWIYENALHLEFYYVWRLSVRLFVQMLLWQFSCAMNYFLQ